jgi:hypothetical protein
MPLGEAATVAALAFVCAAFYAIRAVFGGGRKNREDSRARVFGKRARG